MLFFVNVEGKFVEKISPLNKQVESVCLSQKPLLDLENFLSVNFKKGMSVATMLRLSQVFQL